MDATNESTRPAPVAAAESGAVRTCAYCAQGYQPRKSGQRFCTRECASLARRTRPRLTTDQLAARVARWRDYETEWRAKFGRMLSRRRPRQSVHARLLKRHGLPTDIEQAAFVLGIDAAALRRRIERNPRALLHPLRRYKWRPVTVALNVPTNSRTFAPESGLRPQNERECNNCRRRNRRNPVRNVDSLRREPTLTGLACAIGHA